MVYQGFVLSSNGEQKKIGKELEAIIVFRTEKDDLREKMAKEDKFLGASSEYFP